MATFERDKETKRTTVLRMRAASGGRGVDITPLYDSDGLVVAADFQPVTQ